MCSVRDSFRACGEAAADSSDEREGGMGGWRGDGSREVGREGGKGRRQEEAADMKSATLISQ